MTENEIFLTTEQVAELLKVKRSTLDQWRHKGEGPPYVKIGATIRYKKSSLLEYLDSSTVQSNEANG
jgi:excisionase family DNA binding protein